MSYKLWFGGLMSFDTVCLTQYVVFFLNGIFERYFGVIKTDRQKLSQNCLRLLFICFIINKYLLTIGFHIDLLITYFIRWLSYFLFVGFHIY